MKNQEEAIDFIKRFSFGTIITAKDDQPIATHLPFIVKNKNNKTLLISHFAKMNKQWMQIVEQSVLVIFSEPHAYISPRHYDKELNVPTWNYMAVHVYGKGKLINDKDQVLEVLENTICNYEPAYKPQWEALPDDYKSGMLEGIVAFEIEVTDWQGKKKLSQNKTANEKNKIIDSLLNSESSNERLVAEYMLKENKK